MYFSQKSVGSLLQNKKNKYKQAYINELSVSSIRQKSYQQDTFIFYQENQLLNELQTSYIEVRDQYGLYKTNSSTNFSKKQARYLTSKKNEQKQNSYDNVKYQNLQNSLHFNKQLKRKKLSSKSKDKIISTKTMTTRYSLRQLNQSNDYITTIQKDKIQQTQTSTCQKIVIDINQIIKTPKISLKLNQSPLFNLKTNCQQNNNFTKLYHVLSDDIKIQLNDFSTNFDNQDYNLKSEAYNQLIKIPQQRKQFKSLATIDLKRSRFSKLEKKEINRLLQNPSIKKPQIYLQKNPNKVIQVAKRLSLDCKNSSFYSSRTSDFQSPISKDGGSTATNRIIRRSQIFPTSTKNNYQYFKF